MTRAQDVVNRNGGKGHSRDVWEAEWMEYFSAIFPGSPAISGVADSLQLQAEAFLKRVRSTSATAHHGVGVC